MDQQFSGQHIQMSAPRRRMIGVRGTRPGAYFAVAMASDRQFLERFQVQSYGVNSLVSDADLARVRQHFEASRPAGKITNADVRMEDGVTAIKTFPIRTRRKQKA